MKEPKCFEDACRQVAGELATLVNMKQMDYGQENVLAFGELGLLVRANDKIARLKNLYGKEGITEPTIDAWRDLAGYAIVRLMLDRGWFALPLKGE